MGKDSLSYRERGQTAVRLMLINTLSVLIRFILTCLGSCFSFSSFDCASWEENLNRLNLPPT